MSKRNNKIINLSKYAGKWVALQNNQVIASGDSIYDIEKYVVRNKEEKIAIEKLPAAFKMPRKDECPYIL
ncbi:succinyl-CoA synthetase subunit alpha [Patescibacteria group bacterium]|nr:succinyl-CoA synthetase subunit alpha [Patescibacteria group bacterium]MBU1519493.1 succinyl-CoA synthetase subunit alpha [Patescibacteria group bacterium]MBU2416469.1 succinyl-CoA synthetase subunit alpha [Patescibacteria group bacterium]